MTEITTELIIQIVGLVIVAGFLLSGIRIIRPTHRGLVETFGKYSSTKNSGITYVFPIIQKLYAINITEQIIDVEKQEVITSDNLNATVDAQVYWKIHEDETNLKNSQYNVNLVNHQIVQLARTTLRDIIGRKSFKDVNSDRNELNAVIYTSMSKEVSSWGVDIVRVELKEIEPPKDVQDTMNEVIKAENTKIAAKDYANATEIKAEGDKRARIQQATGIKESQVLEADGQAQAIKLVASAKATEIELVNTAAQTFFKDQAVKLKELEVTQASLQTNSKVIMTKEGINPTLVINETKGQIIPTRETEDE